MKKNFKIILAAMLFFSAGIYANPKQDITNGTILHCFCWSFKTIEENIPKIAEAGFTAVQTSPANTCLVGDYGGLDLLGEDLTGKWYYHYQPTDWKIGNYQLGTRDDFISMCKKAEEYNISVIVDVLPNHTTPRTKEISPDFIEAVGGMEKLYHKNNKYHISDFSDRLQCTTYQMGGLPDVNTENPLFQKYYMNYVNDLIDCGADGFRYDTAKHIGLPDDPKDPYAKENDFWPIFTGQKPIDGVMLKNAENLFIYGEVLQGGNSREKAYTKFFPTVASAYGTVLRKALTEKKLKASKLKDWKHPGSMVTWVESHDTYANHGESAKMKNFELRAGWAIITSRKDGTPLFFSRPKGPEGVQFPGFSQIGDAGNDEFQNAEVKAVNFFRKQMQDEPEELLNYGKSDEICIIKRGNKGLVIVNISKKTSKIDLEVSLKDGKYTDKANSINFTVKDGKLSGKMPKEKIAVIY